MASLLLLPAPAAKWMSSPSVLFGGSVWSSCRRDARAPSVREQRLQVLPLLCKHASFELRTKSHCHLRPPRSSARRGQQRRHYPFAGLHCRGTLFIPPRQAL